MTFFENWVIIITSGRGKELFPDVINYKERNLYEVRPLIGIYKITNLINNKVYIGQTIDYERRINEHIRHYPNSNYHDFNSLLYRAIRKYGINNFSFEMIEECDTNELDDKEIKWIKKYNAYCNWPNSNGYNMTIGGQGNRKITPEQVLEEWNNGLSKQEIVKKFSLSTTTVKFYLRTCNISTKEILERSVRNKSKPVSQYSLKGEYLQSYPSISEAVRSIHDRKASTSGICEACSNNHSNTTAYGYIWKYTDDSTPIEELVKRATNVIHHKDRAINQYTLDGKYVKTFLTIKDAADSCGIKSASAITNVCNGRAKTSGGYIWKYAEINKINKITENAEALEKEKVVRGQPVAQYDLQGNLIKVFINRQEAAKAVDGKPKGISNVCCGDKATYKGYVWKFAVKQKEV